MHEIKRLLWPIDSIVQSNMSVILLVFEKSVMSAKPPKRGAFPLAGAAQ